MRRKCEQLSKSSNSLSFVLLYLSGELSKPARQSLCPWSVGCLWTITFSAQTRLVKAGSWAVKTIPSASSTVRLGQGSTVERIDCLASGQYKDLSDSPSVPKKHVPRGSSADDRIEFASVHSDCCFAPGWCLETRTPPNTLKRT